MNVIPTIYLEGFYTEYLQGRSLEQVEGEILSVYRMNCPVDSLDMTTFKDWS